MDKFEIDADSADQENEEQENLVDKTAYVGTLKVKFEQV